jgi:hypothetical protein
MFPQSNLNSLMILKTNQNLNLFQRSHQSPRTGKISGKTVVAGVLSFLVWPGIGQAVNDQPGGKVATHAVLGLLPPVRFWSGYDALMDRDGGYWDGKI